MKATDARTFKKGDTVTHLQVADSHGGLVWVTDDLTVYSCGKQQMVLVDAAGEKFQGKHFSPTGRCEWTAERGYAHGELVLHADEDAMAAADEMGRAYRQAEVAKYIGISERGEGGAAYLRTMEQHLMDAKAIATTTIERRT